MIISENFTANINQMASPIKVNWLYNRYSLELRTGTVEFDLQISSHATSYCICSHPHTVTTVHDRLLRRWIS